MCNEKYALRPLFSRNTKCVEWVINIPRHEPARGWRIMFFGCAIDRLAIYETTPTIMI